MDLGHMLWFDFCFGLIFLKPTGLNFSNWVEFFKPDRNFKPVYFFGLLSKKRKNSSSHSSILFSPILTEFLLIYSIPQLLYPFPQIPIKVARNSFQHLDLDGL